MKSIKVFAPATIANVGPGYDIFGLALHNIGDTIEMSIREDDQIIISPIKDFPEIPISEDENIVGIVVKAMLNELKKSVGVNVDISKNVMPGSGLGSSGSSAAGAAFALNELLDRPFKKTELINFAMYGEKVISGKNHADNVAASILGGFTVIKGYDPLKVFTIEFPKKMHIAIVHPQVEVKTADAKKILRSDMRLDQVIKQCGNVAGIVAGMTTGNYDLISDSMNDYIAEPKRSYLIPAYTEAKNSALENGAIGCSISGSGPSIFAFTKTESDASKVCTLWKEIYKKQDIQTKTYTSLINHEGCKALTKG